MKILHVCTGWPLSFKGGITNYVRSLAFSQHENGHDVYVLGLEDKEKYPFHYQSYDSKIKPFTYTPLVDKQSLKWLNEYFHNNKFDVIHFHALEKIDWDIYSAVQDLNYVVSLHDYCFICPRIYMYTPDNKVCDCYDEDRCKHCISYFDRMKIFRSGMPRLNRKLPFYIRTPYLPQNITKTRFLKFSEFLNNADYILPVSRKVEDIFRKSGITANSKVLHIGNISADTYKKEFSYDINKQVIKLLFLGRLSPYKGADLFIRIAKSCINDNNIEFHFLGYAGKYEQQLQEAGIINHGSYDQSQLPEILKEYDMGMVLSIWHDNGPQVVMELINNHVPVIGTNMGGIPDFVDEDNGYLFNPYNDDDVSKAIQFIKDLTPEKIMTMKKNIKPTTTTLEHYNELMDVYNLATVNGKK